MKNIPREITDEIRKAQSNFDAATGALLLAKRFNPGPAVTGQIDSALSYLEVVRQQMQKAFDNSVELQKVA